MSGNDETSDRMIRAAHDAATMPTGRDAGAMLSAAGWAVFPVPVGHDRDGCSACPPTKAPCEGKHDTGLSAMYYRHASTSPQTWITNAVGVMRRHRVTDVNIAVVPWMCAVPLIGIDLDGGEAVDGFPALHTGSFRVETSGKGVGRHVYLAGAKAAITGLHRWGGEVRSDRGHLMMAPSLVADRRDYYRPVGGRFPDVSDPAMDEVLAGVSASSSGVGADALPEDEVWETVLAFSRRPAQPWAVAKLDYYLDRLAQAGPGDRHPKMVAAVGCAVACAGRGGLPLRWALERVTEVFGTVLWGEADRNPEREVLAVAAWTLGQQRARTDEIYIDDDLIEWARRAHEES
jgi:hypothetical protein